MSSVTNPTYVYRGGERIADFSVISVIAAGSFGEVYLVRDLSGVDLALKLLKADSEIEMSALTELRRKVGSDPALVTIHHIGEYEGRIYYTMDAADNMACEGAKYCPDTLENRLAFRGAMNVFEVLDLAESLAEALDVLHAHGLVHRDLKPANIIFKNGKPLLADFGLTSPMDGGLAGTPGFMPPERVLTDAEGAQRDFYSLGKVIYCALTNEDADRFPILPRKYAVKDVAAVRKIWLKACARVPSQRFADGAAVRAAVNAARRELCGVAAVRVGKLRMICVGVVAAILAAVAAVVMWGSRPPSPRLRWPGPESAREEETSVYVNIERVAADYLVFCCFTVGEDLDPMSDYNRRKAAALTVDALRRYLNLSPEVTLRPRHVTREREPERSGGVMVYYYRVPIASCELRTDG